MIQRAKAPLRLSFAGGGTDVPPFPEREGGLVLSATIDRYAQATLRPRTDQQVAVESVDFGVEMQLGLDRPMIFDGKLDLVKAAIQKFAPRGGNGYDLLLSSSAPPGSGLGSSSTVAVALVGLLKEHHNLPLTDYEVAALAHSIERDDLGIGGGLQDHYAATFGGFNFIEFEADRVIVNPLRISPTTLHELEHNLLLCFTGKTRRSDGIIDDQVARMQGGDADTLSGLRTQKELAVQMKNALLQGQHTAFGELLGHAWAYKKMMSPKISTPLIDEAYDEAMHHGALGGKVTGAGGGGYMLFYCRFDKKHKVAERLIQMGITVTEVAFDHGGLTTWSVNGG